MRPLLVWFGVPVTIWLASPYPNHIRDFVNLVVNLPVGQPTVELLRKEIGADDRLAIGGQNNELSHAVLGWELGPPSGVRCFPFELSGARRIELSLATMVLLIVPIAANPASLDEPEYYVAQRQAVQDRVDRGELVLRHDISVSDLGVSLRFYIRPTPPERLVRCRW